MEKKQPRPLVTWEPSIGSGIYSFISGIDFLVNDKNRQELVVQQARRILSRCANPTLAVDRKCSLVLGQVQSGKTGHYLGIAAAVADKEPERFPIFILLTQRLIALQQQTYMEAKQLLTTFDVFDENQELGDFVEIENETFEMKESGKTQMITDK